MSDSDKYAIDTVNAMEHDVFVAVFGVIYEDSPWVAGRAWNTRPFADLAALKGAMREAVSSASHASQLALVRAHPQLGTSKVLSTHSTKEQRDAGIQAATRAQAQELLDLNEQYLENFQSPFIIAVKGLSVADIIASARRRVNNDASSEFQISLAEIDKIAEFRLADLVSDTKTRIPTPA